MNMLESTLTDSTVLEIPQNCIIHSKKLLETHDLLTTKISTLKTLERVVSGQNPKVLNKYSKFLNQN